MKILVTSGTGLGSWIIKLLTFSKWTHTATLFDNTVIDVTYLKGVRCMPYSEFLKKYTDIIEIEVPLLDETKARDFAFEQLGKKYDFTALLGILFRNRKWEDDDKWFCSELTETICVHGGVRRMRTEASSILPRETFAVLPH